MEGVLYLRIEVSALRRITGLCQSYGLDYNEIYAKAQLVISVYHEIVWGSLKRGDPGMAGSLGKDYKAALSYLNSFPSDIDKSELQTKLLNLFQSNWFQEIIDRGLAEMSAYARNGDKYAKILDMRFFSEHSMLDKEMYPTLRLTKSTYFRLRKEAIWFLGVCLWGVALPERINSLLCQAAPTKAYMLLRAENKELV